MKFKLSALPLAFASILSPCLCFANESDDPDVEKEVITVYQDVIFFDGYNTLENLRDVIASLVPEDEDVYRINTSLCSVRLTEEQLDRIGESFSFRIEIGALCDNYDRIGNIDLAFVPKGQDTYDINEVQRIEIGRFITPFMNKNIEPTSVPYDFDMDELSLIFHDKKIREQFDIWVEFELFGVPYAANTQVAGCAGRSDVFTGTLHFITDNNRMPLTEDNVFVPIVMKVHQDAGNFNNYMERCTDELGKTVKTWTYELPEDVSDGEIVLIISNHGANSGGEEYNRREHFVYADGELAMVFKPGRTSCEPFRKYNTQPNGIYGRTAMSDVKWQSFSNWCPGDKIDNRIINLGSLSKGTHTIKIDVPKAKFNGGQGDFPVSLFFLGVRNGNLPESSVDPVVTDFRSSVHIANGLCTISSSQPVRQLLLFSDKGELLNSVFNSDMISYPAGLKGVHVFAVEFDDDLVEYHKVIL